VAHYSEKVCRSEPRHILLITTSRVGAVPSPAQAGQPKAWRATLACPDEGVWTYAVRVGQTGFGRSSPGGKNGVCRSRTSWGPSCPTSLTGQFMEMP
jgi:hypothetical protein